MKILQKKSKISTIVLILILAFSATILALPIVSAHDPPWTIPSWTYIVCTPSPVGVGQQLFLVFFADSVPRTASGAMGDRFTFTVHLTKPDGSKETLGPFTSDPVGNGYATYTPDQVGTYTFVAERHELVYKGLPDTTPSTIRSPEFIGDTYLGSTSEPNYVTVQQEPIEHLPTTPLPTEYWTRPIDAYNQEWYEIAGNWLNDGMGNQYTAGPETAHIVWTKPLQVGGIVGGEFGSISYHQGQAYENKWADIIIMNGILVYTVPLGDSTSSSHKKTVAIDLRTGEQLWMLNATRISFGELYEYNTPNQHGVHAYLWETGTTSNIYELTSGDQLYTIENVPSGTGAVGPNGERLIYRYNQNQGWLALWNSSAIPTLLAGTTSSSVWQWRPIGKTHDGTNGYVWNVTVPTDLGSIKWILDDRIIFGDGITGTYGGYGSYDYSISAVSLKPGEEGQLMWKKDYETAPTPSATVFMGHASLEDKVFTLFEKETLSHYGYDLDTGNLLWGPTDPQPSYDMYHGFGGAAYGKLYSTGMSGLIHAYDIKTGELLWTTSTDPCGLEGPYENWPSRSDMVIVNGKIYLTTDEHSTTYPILKGWSLYCFDAETGVPIWNITGYYGYGDIAFADGYMVGHDSMDGQIYCFGKGSSKTTVTAAPKVTSWGSSIVIEGMVTDESAGSKTSALAARFPNGVPAIADDYMTEWMEYVYKQHSRPTNAEGVEVVITTLDPNGNTYEIGRATSDASGLYSLMWEPPVPGKYTIIATFEGSNSYWSSYAETAIGVTEAPSPATPMEPEPTEPIQAAEAPFITTEVAIIAAVAVASIIGIVAFLALRKRK